ncbi:AMP-binding protein [Macrococcus equipercicus]|uniref:AMP-binding protein n=1 Tax=Macrococcus equipercicus TaxID=69967 RepID=A0A9Q9BVJ5_9STAP|nr:AMP-binding protein [Macrococcus equipercicus]UTH13952.1 AMP-binding protein [Macrococcus equipercicus]
MAVAERILQYDGTAIQFDDQCMSYSELQHIMRLTAGYLDSYNKPLKVAFTLANERLYVPLFLGCVLQGARPFLLHPEHPYNDQLLQQIKPDIMIEDGEAFLAKVQQMGEIYEVRAIREDKKELFTGFTSGTTGIPKGYRRSEASWLASFTMNDEVFQLQDVDLFIAGGPLYHSLTLFAAVSALYAGKEIRLMSSFQAGRMISGTEQTAIFGVPSMLELMTEHTTDAPLIFLSSGAKLESHTLHKAAEQFPNMTVYEYFGSSEASYISYLTPEDRKRFPASAGRFFPDVTYRLIDEELVVSSPYIFTGYFGQQDNKGMIATGDIADVEEGMLYLKGRRNNRLIVGGRNVYPEEVESIIQRELDVHEVLVTGKRHYLLGEVAVAIVHPRGNFDRQFADLTIRKQLEKYKWPLKWIVDTNFLYTDSGKIARFAMQERYGLNEYSLHR